MSTNLHSCIAELTSLVQFGILWASMWANFLLDAFSGTVSEEQWPFSLDDCTSIWLTSSFWFWNICVLTWSFLNTKKRYLFFNYWYIILFRFPAIFPSFIGWGNNKILLNRKVFYIWNLKAWPLLWYGPTIQWSLAFGWNTAERRNNRPL